MCHTSHKVQTAIRHQLTAATELPTTVTGSSYGGIDFKLTIDQTFRKGPWRVCTSSRVCMLISVFVGSLILWCIHSFVSSMENTEKSKVWLFLFLNHRRAGANNSVHKFFTSKMASTGVLPFVRGIDLTGNNFKVTLIYPFPWCWLTNNSVFSYSVYFRLR